MSGQLRHHPHTLIPQMLHDRAENIQRRSGALWKLWKLQESGERNTRTTNTHDGATENELKHENRPDLYGYHASFHNEDLYFTNSQHNSSLKTARPQREEKKLVVFFFLRKKKPDGAEEGGRRTGLYGNKGREGENSLIPQMKHKIRGSTGSKKKKKG